MAISRMQQPRQQYGLGSIVKKAVRGVKKIVKSPLGKAALIGGLGYGLNAGAFGGFGKGFLGKTLTGLKSKQGFLGGLGNIFRSKNAAGELGGFSPGKLALGGLGLASVAPLFMGGDNEEVEESVTQLDPIGTVQSAKNYYSGMGDAGVGLNFMPKKKYVSQNFYAADGGRAGYANGMMVEDDDDETVRMQASQFRRQPVAFLNMGGDAGNAQAEQMLMAEFVKYKNKGGDLSFEQFVKAVMQQQEQAQGMEQPMMAANGGRMGYNEAGPVIDQETINMVIDMNSRGMDMDTMVQITGQPVETITNIINSLTQQANGGPVPGSEVAGYTTPAGYNKFDYRSGGVRVNAAEGGIMDAEAAEMIDMGGNEKDYRDEGGFVAMGGEERADDVPARLSKNEFVFTADAVRNAGGGDIDRGSEVMQNLMDNLEQGGQVSEDSQGMGGEEEMMSEEIIEEPNGAQAMYEQQQALQSRMI